MSRKKERTALRWRTNRSPNRSLEDRYYTDAEFYGCALKLWHPDYLSAILHIRRIRAERPLASMKVYECEFCGGLHITTGRSDKDSFKLQRSLEILQGKIAASGYSEGAPKHVQAKQAQTIIYLQFRIDELKRLALVPPPIAAVGM